MNVIANEAILLHEGLRSYTLQSVVHFYDEIYVFATHHRFSDIVLYYYTIDKTSLLPSSPFTELKTFNFVRGNWPDFFIELSRKETKLLIASRIKLLWSGVQFNEFYVFDKDLEPLWEKQDYYEYDGQGPRDNNYIVDDQGNVSILSLLKRESILSLFSEIRNLYTIYRYTSGGKEFNEYPVTLNERYIRGIDIVAGNQGELICSGLFSEQFRTGMRGTFYFRIDPETARIYDFRLNDFDQVFLQRLAELKEPTLKSNELIEYVITDLVIRDNDRIIMIAEQFFDQPYDTYNNLIITCLDLNGQVYWNQVVEKNQNFNVRMIDNSEIDPSTFREYVINTGIHDQYVKNYSSYALMAPVNRNEIIIFYNDAIKNIDQDDKKNSFTNPRRSYLLAVTIDEYGNMSQQPLFKWERRNLFPEPIRFYDTLHETIIIPAFRGGSYNYFKISADF